MRSPRTDRMVCYLERGLAKPAKQVGYTNFGGDSNYIRVLIMQDLIRRGLVTPDDIVDITTGLSLPSASSTNGTSKD